MEAALYQAEIVMSNCSQKSQPELCGPSSGSSPGDIKDDISLHLFGQLCCRS